MTACQKTANLAVSNLRTGPHSIHLLNGTSLSMVDTWHNSSCHFLAWLTLDTTPVVFFFVFVFFACYILVSFFLNLGLQLVFRQLETGSFIFEQGWDVMIQYPCTEWWVLSEARYHFSILYFICEMQAGTSALHCTAPAGECVSVHCNQRSGPNTVQGSNNQRVCICTR